MGNIETGEYVRTVDGKIGTFVKYSSRKDDSLYKSPANCFIRLNKRKSDLQCFKDYILKHSKNIIDLIEVGDIVKVLDIDWIRVFKLDDKDFIEAFKEDLENGDWKLLSIVTKEQFSQAEYKIEKGE